MITSQQPGPSATGTTRAINRPTKQDQSSTARPWDRDLFLWTKDFVIISTWCLKTGVASFKNLWGLAGGSYGGEEPLVFHSSKDMEGLVFFLKVNKQKRGRKKINWKSKMV